MDLVAMEKRKLTKDFYETQKQQWRKSLFVYTMMILFYLFVVGSVVFSSAAIVGFFMQEKPLSSTDTLLALTFASAVIALIIATFHYFDARNHGAKFIRKRLQAKAPDPSDRYHKQFANTLEEMRIAAGLPKVYPYVLPAFAINSMALIEPDGTPSVLVTEGLIAEFTRDELQAVIAHELAHVVRGDTYYVTLVCSLVNFFERLRDASTPETHPEATAYSGQSRMSGAPLVWVALTISTFIMHLLSTLISRQREVLADAAAVEFTRNPKPLARAIYKAHLKNSFVGDFSIAYSPLLIVPPRSTGITDGFFSRLFNTHPPLMRRIRMLANMFPTHPASIIQEVWDIHKSREKARLVIPSQEEVMAKREGKPLLEDIEAQEGKLWMIQDPDGEWNGPHTLADLFLLDFFLPSRWIRNIQEQIEAPASEFPQIQMALRKWGRKPDPVQPKENNCPRCRIPLRENYYEGVPIKICPDCGGKLIDAALMERVIARKEVAFSDHLKAKAKDFEENFLFDPVLRKKIHSDKSPKIACPCCGEKMRPRPYNYQYVIPVDKCLRCHKIWFDADELEILQILIER
jgi:Zn-dependent protease with chaperone function/Zn-finger nucleic acid-binding protein